MRKYRTAKAAALIGIHPNTVRFYEEWGLITKPEREENGYRIFTDLHIQQMRLVRAAFRIEVLQNGLRKKIVDTVKAAAQCDFDRALILIREYTEQVKKEQLNAEEAIEIVRDILSGDVQENDLFMKRKEVSDYLGITIDTLRNWEMNGLLKIKRKQNGYRVYTGDDIRHIKIIRSLRCANYSLEAILRMLNQLIKNPDINIKKALNFPEQNKDIISACDKLLVSLAEAETNAYKIMAIIEDMIIKFPQEKHSAIH